MRRYGFGTASSCPFFFFLLYRLVLWEEHQNLSSPFSLSAINQSSTLLLIRVIHHFPSPPLPLALTTTTSYTRSHVIQQGHSPDSFPTDFCRCPSTRDPLRVVFFPSTRFFFQITRIKIQSGFMDTHDTSSYIPCFLQMPRGGCLLLSPRCHSRRLIDPKGPAPAPSITSSFNLCRCFPSMLSAY